MNYIVSNSTVRVAMEDDLVVMKDLPAGIYTPETSMTGRYLQRRDPFQVPARLLGDVEKHARRILGAFFDRTASTGVLLSGVKGSGKSLLAKHISKSLLDMQVSTIVVPIHSISGDLCTYLDMITCPCCVYIDELDKIDEDKQNLLLGLLDGVASNKKLFMLTANSTYRISDFLMNRPGRVFYHIRHSGVDEQTVRDYCESNLKNTVHTKQILEVYSSIADFSFDLLIGIVEECNRSDESPKEFLHLFNTTMAGDAYFKVELLFEGKSLLTEPLCMQLDPTENFAIYIPRNHRFRAIKKSKASSDKGESLEEAISNYDSDWEQSHFVSSDNGRLRFERPDGYTLFLTPDKSPRASAQWLV